MKALIESKVPPAGIDVERAVDARGRPRTRERPSTRRRTTPARLAPGPKFSPRSTSARCSTITTPGRAVAIAPSASSASHGWPLVSPLEGVTPLATSRVRWLRTAWASQPAKSPVASTVVDRRAPVGVDGQERVLLPAVGTSPGCRPSGPARRCSPWGSAPAPAPAPRRAPAPGPVVRQRAGLPRNSLRHAREPCRASARARASSRSSSPPGLLGWSSSVSGPRWVATGASPRGVVPGPLAQAAPTPTPWRRRSRRTRPGDGVRPSVPRRRSARRARRARCRTSCPARAASRCRCSCCPSPCG